MASRQSQRRLTKEYKAIQATPPPFITAKPNDENILEWHYIITGPTNTPFENGQYHGILRFPSEYPFKPPSITMITPNGRFACNTRLCLSMSDYHPDTWNPAWSVATILTGLLSFMTGNESTTGSINTSENVKKKLANSSKKWNIKENPRFIKQFPNIVNQNKIDIKQKEIEEQKAEEEAKKAQLLSQNNNNTTEKPFDISELKNLDPEDRARILIEHELNQQKLLNQKNSNKSQFFLNNFLSGGGLTALAGVIVAAFVAAYFSIIKK
ncbi:UBC6 [Candida pseudojiufengensis]|uniref:UBC6 n=1 Tax=Candida pseudojiufengensis TaxID=497109 RepID=UPI0022246E1D|nr:UBC6 [Candida pseudojiufengensis]KAI5961593.1 UBC6 [Candida pseudojiufengensis]